MIDPMTAKREATVEFQIGAAAEITDETLEERAFAVLDALERDLAEIVIGPTMACDFHNGRINLLFDLEGHSESEIQEQIGRVVTAIEQTLGVEHPLSTSKVPADAPASDPLSC